MNKNKKLLTAIATLGGSVALLVGGAFAWFSASSDLATGGQFVIGSMDLAADLYLWDVEKEGGAGWVEGQTNITVQDMMPGDSRFYAIKAENTGTSAGSLDFTLDKGYTDGVNATDERFALSKMMLLTVTNADALPATVTSTGSDDVDTDTEGTAQAGSIYTLTNQGTTPADYVESVVADFTASSVKYIVLEFHFSGAAGNEYQELTLVLNKIIVSITQPKGVDVI